MGIASRTLALIALATGCSAAHDLYLLPDSFLVEKGRPVSFGIHNGDSFPESEASPSLDRLRDVVLQGRSFKAEAKNLHVDGKRAAGIVTPAGTGEVILTAHTIPNFIQMEPAKFADYLKEEGLGQVIAWRAGHGEVEKPGRERYSKYAKALLLAGSPGSYYDHVTGDAIEIIPEKDPYVLKTGEQLPIRILFHGQPAPGLSLESAWIGPQGKGIERVGVTDSQGRVQVPLRADGQWRLHTIKIQRSTDPAADWESYWASLTFQVGDH